MYEAERARHGLRSEGRLQPQPPRVVAVDGPAGLQLVPGVRSLVCPVSLSEPKERLETNQIWNVKPI